MADDAADPRLLAALAELAPTASGVWFVGRHIRGLWVNTCTASQPISWPRSIAVQMPPEDETWAPKSMRPRYTGSCLRWRLCWPV